MTDTSFQLSFLKPNTGSAVDPDSAVLGLCRDYDMQISTLGGTVTTLRPLIFSLFLFLLATQPAFAQAARDSATNSVASRATPSPVPKASFSLPHNSCLAPIYESLSRGVPYTGMCEKQWVAGKYTCRHFARDFCEAILSNSSNQAMGSSCWVLALGPDYSSPKKVLKIVSCVAAECGMSWFSARTADLGTSTDTVGKMANFVSRAMCSEKERKCVEDFVGSGHAINIFRTGGKEFLDRNGEVTFMVVEPQYEDGGSAVLCTWTQKTLEPVLPDGCKDKVARDTYPGQVARGIPYRFKVVDFDEFVAEVTRWDNVSGFETSKP